MDLMRLKDTPHQAVSAAGNWSVDAAWPHVAGLLGAEDADKSVRLAAIEASANIRPGEAGALLGDLLDSEDEDIVEAAYEALTIAEGLAEGEDYDDEETIH